MDIEEAKDELGKETSRRISKFVFRTFSVPKTTLNPSNFDESINIGGCEYMLATDN